MSRLMIVAVILGLNMLFIMTSAAQELPTEELTAPLGDVPVETQPMLAPVSAPRSAPISLNDCPATHPVKGNQSGLYHVPTGQFYSRTNPEACFLTGADAEAAGFKASSR